MITIIVTKVCKIEEKLYIFICMCLWCVQVIVQSVTINDDNIDLNIENNNADMKQCWFKIIGKGLDIHLCLVLSVIWRDTRRSNSLIYSS